MRILVADDDECCREVLAQTLQQFGYPFEVVTNGAEAVQAFQERPYDLVLMDCQMLGMNGFEATRLIRQLEKVTGSRVPIIAVTGSPTDRCKDAGMDECLSKPYTKDQLRAVLNRWLSE